MTLRPVASVLAGVALIFAMAIPAQALPRDCDVRCTPSTPSDIVCACGWGTHITTCGEWYIDYCGLLLTPQEKPSDLGLPNTALTDLGITSYGTR